MKLPTNPAKFSILAILALSAILTSTVYIGFSASQLTLTTTTNKLAYYVREKVTTQGDVLFGGSPVSNALVALEMHSQNDVTMAYRTATIGTPDEMWVLDVSDIAVLDSGYNRLNTVRIGQTYFISASVSNPNPVERSHVYIAISVFDGNKVTLRPYIDQDVTIAPQSTHTVRYQLSIPSWTYSGKATIYVNVYNDLPSNGGIPYLPERSAQFYVSRTEEGWLSYPLTASASTQSQLAIGSYSLQIGLPPTLTPGTYSVYSSARYRDGTILYTQIGSTTFGVLYTPIPPSAAFMWLPIQPYPNTTVTFDGSASSPNNYNDTIIRYEWNFGDGTPKVIKTGTPDNPPDPTATHKFMASGTYTVTLNVTDMDGLWGTAQAPLATKPTNPTAAFTWTPVVARINQAATFDATTSLPGWSIRTASPAPIVSYVWNFGDGTGPFTVATPILDHTFTSLGNFTVNLNVIDSENQQNSVSHTVQVLNVTAHPWDINNDLKCDIKDIAIVAKAFGSVPGDPKWDPRADITGPTPLVPDGKVDVRDVALVAKHFGEVY